MWSDFHYYALAVIARCAGYRPKDALTLAFASQYVDDADENKPVKIGDVFFDPVCTAYQGIRSVTWSVQKNVYLPFHFLPPKPLRFPDISFITAPDSPLARDILKEGLNEKDGSLRLYRLGIALHTYADTWAHQGFSGRTHPENAVVHRQDGKGKELPLVPGIFAGLIPEVGHAQAGFLPDIPSQKWQYKTIDGKSVERDNPAIYLEAADAIYRFLSGADPANIFRRLPGLWRKTRGEMIKLFETPFRNTEDHHQAWEEQFSQLFKPYPFRYDKHAWKRQALISVGAKKIDWESIPKEAVYEIQFALTRDFYRSSWVQFHRAALKQRHYVLERLI